MTTAVTTTVLEDGPRNCVIHRQGVQSDTTGEGAAIFANISDMSNVTPNEAPSHFAIKKIRYAISGFSNVQLFFDATTDDPAAKLPPDSGEIVFDPPLVDPQSTGSTGDIVLTTTDGTVADNDAYDITLHLIKKQ